MAEGIALLLGDNPVITVAAPGNRGDPVARFSNHNGSQDISDYMLSGKQSGEKDQKGHEQGGGLAGEGDCGLPAHACKAEPANQAVNGGKQIVRGVCLIEP